MTKGPAAGIRRYEAAEYEVGNRVAKHQGMEDAAHQSPQGLRNVFTLRKAGR